MPRLLPSTGKLVGASSLHGVPSGISKTVPSTAHTSPPPDPRTVRMDVLAARLDGSCWAPRKQEIAEAVELLLRHNGREGVLHHDGRCLVAAVKAHTIVPG